MKKIKFCGHKMQIHHAGILFWPDQDLAVVSDLHLEKGSHFAINGQFLPQQESVETLELLLKVLSKNAAKKLILLGDTFHDAQGYHRMGPQAADLFSKLCDIAHVIWIIGNHDGAFIPPKTEGMEEYKLENIIFRHEAKRSINEGEISGHYHPKARLQLRGSKVSRPCFIRSEQRLIMPAFGTLTGGMDVRDPIVQQFFGDGFTCDLLGKEKLYEVPSERILA